MDKVKEESVAVVSLMFSPPTLKLQLWSFPKMLFVSAIIINKIMTI